MFGGLLFKIMCQKNKGLNLIIQTALHKMLPQQLIKSDVLK